MSRIANNAIIIPAGIEVSINNNVITIKNAKTAMTQSIHPAVRIKNKDKTLIFSPSPKIEKADAFAGTMRALVNNMVVGLSEGFERRLVLVGVGYRAQVQGKKLVLSLGFSHPINYQIPEGITVETPSQTEIVVKGVEKQLVGKVAAEIRTHRPPEPYKGKGVKYEDEIITRKEGKKK